MIVGLNFAKNIFRKKPAEDKKVVFFGPNEDSLAKRDPEVDSLIRILREMNIVPIACNGYVAAHNITEDIAKIGMKLEDASDTITNFADQGYRIITFRYTGIFFISIPKDKKSLYPL